MASVTWLNNAVVYQIYPQSFFDSNGDGIGDLQGITAKLDYIQSCGFTAVWLNPINPSSFRDAGYDVTDFCDVDPRYGTLQDYKKLCDALHARGMKIIFDLVAGHTAIEHPWFLESAKVEKNRYSNRYIWTVSTFDEGEGIAGLGERDAKCINNFFWHQPALNYGYAHPNPDHPWELPVDHPDCVEMKHELMRIIDFWMDLGTDAFRVDMAQSLIKGDTDGSCTKQLWQEIRAHIESRNAECLLIAEWGAPGEAIQTGFHLDFLLHFGPTAYRSLFRYEKGRNTFTDFTGNSYFHKAGKGDINEFLQQFMLHMEQIQGNGNIGLITGNHDMPRLAYGRTPEEIKAAMVFLFTMPGVPFVYYGDEIGMDYIENLPSKEGGYIRTGARTPMQWDDGKNHGFSESDAPYLPVDCRACAPTVAAQMDDPSSVLSCVKQLISLHKQDCRLWADGQFHVLLAGYPFVYERMANGKKLLIAINPSESKRTVDCPEITTVYLSQNAVIRDGQLTMDGVSFLIAEEE